MKNFKIYQCDYNTIQIIIYNPHGLFTDKKKNHNIMYYLVDRKAKCSIRYRSPLIIHSELL